MAVVLYNMVIYVLCDFVTLQFIDICCNHTYRLSEREKLDYAYKKKLYQLASEHEKVSNELLLGGINWNAISMCRPRS